jgi:hypothetical protein
VPPPEIKPRRAPIRLIVGGLALVVVVAVLAATLSSPRGSTPVAGGDTATGTPSPTVRPTAQPTPTLRPVAPTETPAPAEPTPGTFVPGDTVTVTSNDEPLLDILVDKVSVHSKYDGQYSDDTPEVKGNVFIQARVTYTALQNGASYNPFDWNVFVDDRAVDSYAFLINGPEPQLSSGDLPKGRTAQGWLVYEVPATGKVVLSFRANMFTNDAPVFEVVLRGQ